jgi:hypothetical protein
MEKSAIFLYVLRPLATTGQENGLRSWLHFSARKQKKKASRPGCTALRFPFFIVSIVLFQNSPVSVTL